MKRNCLIAVLMLAASPLAAQYCTSTSNYTNCNNVEEYISNVTIGSMSHNSSCLNAPAYEDFTAVPGPTLIQLSGTAIQVTVSEWYSTTDTVTVFCDWNGNTILNDPGEVFPLVQGVGNSGGNTIYTGTITAPAGAVASTRMRVKTVWGVSTNPCGASGYSDTEDYTISTIPPSGLVAAGAANPATLIAGAPTLLTVSMSATQAPNPPTGCAVSINLSSIGGNSAQTMFDDGVTGGDLVAGDNVFSWTASPATNGNFLLSFDAYDSLARTANGTISLTVNPNNDSCASSATLALGTNGPYSNVNATDSGVTASCSAGYKDVWFNFTPPCTGAYKIDTCGGAPFDTVLSVYGGCGQAELACNNNGTGTCGVNSSIASINLTAGVPVLIRVASVGTTQTGSWLIHVNQVFSLTWTSPSGPGSAQFDMAGGPIGGTYYLAVSLYAGNFPAGWLYGVDITWPDIVTQISFGFPFVGPLNACGGISVGPFGGLPSGLTAYTVALASAGPLGLPTTISPAVAYTIP